MMYNVLVMKNKLFSILEIVSRRDCEIVIDDNLYTFGIRNNTHLEPIIRNDESIERISIEDDIKTILINDYDIDIITQRGEVKCMCFREKLNINSIFD